MTNPPVVRVPMSTPIRQQFLRDRLSLSINRRSPFGMTMGKEAIEAATGFAKRGGGDVFGSVRRAWGEGGDMFGSEGRARGEGAPGETRERRPEAAR